MATALLCVGCTEDKPREPDPTTKPSPTATVPSMPNEAEANTVDGAIAFVEHYVELLNYSSDTGDVAALSDATDAECAGCDSYVSLYKSTYASGGYFRDPGWSITRIDPDIQNKSLLVFVSVTSHGGTFREKSGSEVQKSRDEKYNLIFTPTLHDGQWKVSRFVRETGK
ncbi:DUF6318 family protein [Aeromicrobium sp.]